MNTRRLHRMKKLPESLLQRSIIRYLFGLAMLAVAFFLRLMVAPLTGAGAPFVLFLGAMLVTSLIAGVGPGAGVLVIGLPLAAYMFIVPAGYSYSQAAFQALLYAIDGALILYLISRVNEARRVAQRANLELREDITARKRLEDERQVFVALLDNSSDFIGIADPNGKPIYLNPAGRKMVGLAPDYPVESSEILDYYPPDERGFVTAVILKNMIARGRWSGETRFRNWKTGEAIPVSDEHFMVRDASGTRILGMATISRDITETRRMYDRLRESEERFRLTIDEAPIGKALVALDGRFVRVNRALCDIVGYESFELTRLTFQAITHPDDVETESVSSLANLPAGRSLVISLPSATSAKTDRSWKPCCTVRSFAPRTGRLSTSSLKSRM